jgi:hypothetical protein
MKIRYLIILIGFAFHFQVFSQTEFVPGFYLVNNNAKYAQRLKIEFDYMPYMPGSKEEVDSYGSHIEHTDDGPVVTSPDSYLYTETQMFSTGNARLREGMVVMAFMINSNRVYCFDLEGNPIVFSGINDLTKVSNTGSIGMYSSEFNEELMDGPTLSFGYYWILSQNTSNETVKIQLPKTTVDIRAEKITFWKKEIGKFYDNAFETNGSVNEEIEITIVK